MVRNVSPPLIILLDMLFIFLFILVLNNDSVIDIKVPEKRLFDDATLVYLNGDKYVSVNDNLPLSYTSPLIKCTTQNECGKHGDKELYIALSKKTVSEISEITITALEPEYCKSLIFVISEDGNINIDKLLTDNTCLTKISGFDKKYIKK